MGCNCQRLRTCRLRVQRTCGEKNETTGYSIASLERGQNLIGPNLNLKFAALYNAAHRMDSREVTGVSPEEARCKQKNRARSIRRKIKGVSQKRHK